MKRVALFSRGRWNDDFLVAMHVRRNVFRNFELGDEMVFVAVSASLANIHRVALFGGCRVKPHTTKVACFLVPSQA